MVTQHACFLTFQMKLVLPPFLWASYVFLPLGLYFNTCLGALFSVHSL
jgi:hypothetical protein